MTAKLRWGLGIVGLLFVLASIVQIVGASRGLTVTTIGSATPMTVIAPADATPGSRPLVLIGHGYAGSGLVMRGFALTLAHAGYVAVTWDFDGHGANKRPLQAAPLIQNAETVLAEAESRGLVTPARVAILGHSMGSGVALEFGQTHPNTAATIAVSPVHRAVTPSSPRNLLLMAGSLEGGFVHNAEVLLSEAGGSGGSPADGTGRKLVVIPGVEHMSILFAPAAHAAAVDWLDKVFGPQPGATRYVDGRMPWYVLSVLGTLLIALAVSPLVREPAVHEAGQRPYWWRFVALAGGALVATLVLWAAQLAGLELRALFGLEIGGYLLVWFGLAGVSSSLLLGQWPSSPSPRALLAGLIVFAFLWLSVGLLGQWVWFPWLVIWERLRLWPLAVLFLLPWFWVVSQVFTSRQVTGQCVQWLVHSVVLTISLFLALQLSPELGFLILILPAFPAILGLQAGFAASYGGPWPFALSGALFVGWVLLVIFPLQG